MALDGILDTANAVTKLNDLNVAPIAYQLNTVKGILDGLDDSQMKLAITTSTLSESRKKLLLAELGLIR